LVLTDQDGKPDISHLRPGHIYHAWVKDGSGPGDDDLIEIVVSATTPTVYYAAHFFTNDQGVDWVRHGRGYLEGGIEIHLRDIHARFGRLEWTEEPHDGGVPWYIEEWRQDLRRGVSDPSVTGAAVEPDEETAGSG
jgi:hypothetical protein